MENRITNPKLDELMSETIVVRAVDDGDGVLLEAPTEDTRGPYESSIPFEHWAEGQGSESASHRSSLSQGSVQGAKAKLRAVQGELKHRFEGVKDDLKYRVEGVKDKAYIAGDQVKAKVSAADESLRANPYLYALGAVALGFAIGRLIMSSKKPSVSYDVSDFKDNNAEHTGVHIRHESRYATY
ncbi:MAG: hypothetical protein V4655_03775 [Bdellovibrionota bacterium]|nr:MAG: hypothetical protein EOP10_14435 [Pseudomonadota bacterium]